MGDPSLVPLRAMIGCLSPPARKELARVLHAKLNRPVSPAERRVRELGLLARVLDEVPQPPERLPYVERKLYDARREETGRAALSSSTLADRFGSWKQACRAAWGLLRDGRSVGDRDPWARPPRGAPYTIEEARATLHECARALGRVPTSHEFHMWVMERRSRARQTGEAARVAHLSSVYRLIAPDRSDRNGWQLIVRRVFGRD